MEVAGDKAVAGEGGDVGGGAVTGGRGGLVVPAINVGGNLVVDASAELCKIPWHGGKDVFAVGEGAGDVAETKKTAEGSFGKAAGVGIGLVELAADFGG